MKLCIELDAEETKDALRSLGWAQPLAKHWEVMRDKINATVGAECDAGRGQQPASSEALLLSCALQLLNLAVTASLDDRVTLDGKAVSFEILDY